METMYAVLVKMIPSIDPPPYQFAKNFDREKFFQLFWQFAIVDALFFALVYHFMRYKVNMRLDRVAAWLSQQTFEGKDRNILAGTTKYCLPEMLLAVVVCVDCGIVFDFCVDFVFDFFFFKCEKNTG